MQHWLLVPTPGNQGDESYKDQMVAYVFRFATLEDFRIFQQRFSDNPQIFFPQFGPLVGPASNEALAVGVSRLGNLDEIFRFLEENADGEFFLTGVPIVDFGEVLAGSASVSIPEADNIVAIIDTDIAFANARFRDTVTTTRIAGFWDQDAGSGPAQPTVIGKVVDRDTINDYLQDFEQNGTVDEPALYAKYYADCYLPDAYPRLPPRIGHGTHVLDLIDGAEFDATDSETVPILAVDLRSRAVDATHGGLLLPWVALGLQWVGAVTAGRQPQVNFSFGAIAGRHDGDSPLERLLDWMIATGVVSAVTIPAGNFYGSETHAGFSGDELSSQQSLNWIIQPNDGTSNMLEIWLPACSPDEPQLSATLRSPDGTTETFTDADIGTFRELADENGEIWARIYIQCVGIFGGTSRVRIAIFVRHTDIHRDYFQYLGGVPGLAGIWRLDLEAVSLDADDRVELWVERDDALGIARNGARQSYFEAPRPVWPEPTPVSFVRNDGTTSDIACGERTLVAAGTDRATRQPAGYSSEGFGRDTCNGAVAEPVAFPPTAAATCEDSRVHGGVLASGFFSGSTVAMNGTSVASGMVARKVKDEIFAGNGVTRSDIEALAAGEDGRPIPPTACIHPLFGTYDPVPPETRIGSGCLRLPWTRLPRFLR